jgi:hypothetical protein
MKARAPAARQVFGYLTIVLAAVLVGALGYLAFLAFVKGVLRPKEFASYGLAITTIFGATASFFSPCAFTVFPSFVVFAGASTGETSGERARRAALRGAVAALGVVTSVAIIGVVVAALGASAGPSFSIFSASPNSAVAKGLRLAVGGFVAVMGLVLFFNLSHRIPLAGRLAAWAGEVGGVSAPSLRSVYVYGATYVAVGFG